jgi:hypothetical protein
LGQKSEGFIQCFGSMIGSDHRVSSPGKVILLYNREKFVKSALRLRSSLSLVAPLSANSYSG